MALKTSPVPTIKVRIWMKPTIYGGRSHPFWVGYCPHLVAKGKETLWGIRVKAIVHAPQSDAVFPGNEAQIVCQLMCHDDGFEYDDLKRGATFEMREGSRVVGTGVVLSDFEWEA